jgi:hypothetical protein
MNGDLLPPASTKPHRRPRVLGFKGDLRTSRTLWRACACCKRKVVGRRRSCLWCRLRRQWNCCSLEERRCRPQMSLKKFRLRSQGTHRLRWGSPRCWCWLTARRAEVLCPRHLSCRRWTGWQWSLRRYQRLRWLTVAGKAEGRFPRPQSYGCLIGWYQSRRLPHFQWVCWSLRRWSQMV